jgi:type I restriction enzyme, R subunit
MSPQAVKTAPAMLTLNEHFGLELGDADQLLFDQFEEVWAADTELADQARNNTMENFRLVFGPKFINTIITRMDDNQAIFKQILDDSEFQEMLSDYYVRKIYSRLRSAGAAD